jgi:hypothetical protein
MFSLKRFVCCAKNLIKLEQIYLAVIRQDSHFLRKAQISSAICAAASGGM